MAIAATLAGATSLVVGAYMSISLLVGLAGACKSNLNKKPAESHPLLDFKKIKVAMTL